MIPKNVIVNADDFGLHPDISNGIAHCLEQGWVNSLSLLSCKDPSQLELLKNLWLKHPQAGYGCHLCLWDGIPQSEPAIFLASGGSLLFHYLGLTLKILFQKNFHKKLYREWKSQLQCLLILGLPITHVDGHQHIHLFPTLYPIAKRLQKEFQIPRLRIPFESIGASLFHRFPAGFLFQLLARLRYEPKRDGRFVGFFSSMGFKAKILEKQLDAILSNPARKWEIMVHPGFSPKSNPPHWKGKWEGEMLELKKLSTYFETRLWNKAG